MIIKLSLFSGCRSSGGVQNSRNSYNSYGSGNNPHQGQKIIFLCYFLTECLPDDEKSALMDG